MGEQMKQVQMRKEAVSAFLKVNGFKGVAVGKKSMMMTTYPLHCAVERCDARMVAMLLEEGASSAQKDTFGKTAEEVAKKKDRKGSHAEVLRALKAGGPGGALKAGGAGGARGCRCTTSAEPLSLIQVEHCY